MFKTPAGAEVDLCGIFGTGYRHWRVAAHHNFPWLHLAVVSPDQDGLGATSEFLMVSDPQAFERLLDELDEGQLVQNVQMVTPAWLGEHQRWAMEPLESIFAALDEHGREIHLCKAQGGQTYAWGFGSTVAEQLSVHRVIYAESDSTSALAFQ